MKTKVKVCSRCKKRKGLEEFGTEKRARDGKKSGCRGCCAAAALLWAQENREKTRENSAKWKSRNPTYSAEWKKLNPEKHSASSVRWGKSAEGRASHARALAKRQQKAREKALILMGRACAAPGCSQNLHEIAWGAHHKTPRAVSGRPEISWAWSWVRIRAELLNGCELLCVPCHRATNHVSLIKSAVGF